MNNHGKSSLSRWLVSVYGLCVALVLGESFAAWGATYYVAQMGNDSNPGTLIQPFRSFAQGISMLQPGDTLYIRGGIYTEPIDTGKKAGTAEKYITIAAYQGETVTLQPQSSPSCKYAIVPRTMNYMILDGLVWDGSSGCNGPYGFRIVGGTHHLIVQNMEIKNVKSTGIYIEANNITIRNNKIHDQVSLTGKTGERWYGIYFHHGKDSVIEGNDIYNNPGGGMQIYPGPISNLVVRSNKLHHNNFLESSNVEGIIVYGGGLETPISDVQIYNNLIYLNGVNQPDPGRSGGIRVANRATGIKVWNNTVYGNKGWGINMQIGMGGPPVDTEVRNNIVFDNRLGEIVDAGIGSTLSHNLTTDPKFMNVRAFDFRLQSHSPAIDMGADLRRQVAVDFKNVPRPQGAIHDIGAYEMERSDSTTPAVPKNLVVR